MNHNKNVWCLSVWDDVFSIQLLYRNTLDNHCKHTASHLHVSLHVPWDYHWGWFSSDKCDMWTKYLHCVTSADVPWDGQVVWNCLNSVYMNINMTLQIMARFKQLPTVTTVVRSSVAVCMTFMWLQVAGLVETFVTQWTLVRFVSRVDSHVSVQTSRLTKHLGTHVTFVWFLSTVNSPVLNKISWLCKSFATNSAF